MILYCDTSALVKLFFEEKYSAAMLAARQEAEAVATSVVGYAEFLAAANRKRRDGDLDSRAYRRLATAFEKEWFALVRVEVTDELNEIVARLVQTYPLRGFDAVHLASAVLLNTRLTESETRFATFDERQRRAGEAEGLAAVPPMVQA